MLIAHYNWYVQCRKSYIETLVWYHLNTMSTYLKQIAGWLDKLLVHYRNINKYHKAKL